MRGQWGLLTGIIIILIIAIFAVLNVDPVPVNFLISTTNMPLVLVIIGSVLMGGLIVGSVGMYKIYRLQKELKQLKNKLNMTEESSDNKDKKSKGSSSNIQDDEPDQLRRSKKKS